MRNIFGVRMSYLREKQGMSKSELGRRLGISQPTVTRWENGERRPDLTHAVRLADLFDVSLDYLNGRTDDPKARLSYPQRDNRSDFYREFY